MFFTQDDYKKIQQWLIKNSVKDTEFNEANIPFNGEETITIVQGNQNKKVFLKDLIAQVFNLGISDFVNITDKYNAPNISLEEAIRLIPSRARKEGQVITFLNKEDGWNIYQFKGVLNQWNVLDKWEDLFNWENLIIDSILPDEEDLTKSLPDANGNSYLSLKDRVYNPEDFSGLGRIILRKNIVEIEDPIYGKVKKNYLYQDMFTQSNTVYEIRYDFDLNNQTITIPENCTLKYEGGSFNNGHIVYQNTKIQGIESLNNITTEGLFVVISVVSDEEDLHNNNGVLKFADREYNPNAFSGLGKIILRKNIVNGKNILTQDMINKENTIYEIRYDFDLNGAEITIPEGCVLDFQGGNLSNGSIKGNSTLIESPIIKIFELDINLVGSFSNDNVYPEWFGAIGDGVVDDLASINKTVQVAHNLKATIKFHNKNYAINGTILIGTGIRLQGDAVVGQYSQNTIISQKGDFNAIEINNIKAFSDPIAYYTNISIKDITIDMEGHRYSGIYYKRDSDDLNFKVFQFNRFSNLYIKNGYNGIYMKFIDNIDGFLYGEFINLNLSDNIIGLHLDGSSFINLNTFYKCFFSRNKNIGIRISGGTLENNRFDTCSIEANGQEYDKDAYELYGSSGATFIGSKGYNILDNCYMENNYPIRDNKYPSDLDDNFYTANIVCKGCTLISKNSLYAAYNRGINIGGVHCGLELSGNDYWNPLKDSKNDSFVKIWNGTFNVLYGYQKFLFLDEVRANVSKLNYAFEFEVDRVADVINYNIDDRSKFPKSNNIEVKGTKVISESINFYIDGINNGSGISEKNPAKTLEDIKGSSYFRNINNKVIYILGECYSGTPSNTIISGKKVYIKGVPDKNSKIIFNTYLYNWNVDEIIFEDLNIDLTTTYGLRLDKINSVIFNNCTINLLEQDGHSFLRTNLTNPVFTNVVINNTSIKSAVLNPVHNHVCSGNPKMYKIFIGEGTIIDNGIHLVDCDNVDFYNQDSFYLSYPNGYFAYDSKIGSFCYYNNKNWSILSSLPYNTKSSGYFEHKPSDVPIGFAYFCLNKKTEEGANFGITIYYKGEDTWVDALGRVVE